MSSTAVNATLSALKTRFPYFSAPVPLHWLEKGLALSVLETRVLSVVMVGLILFSYTINTIWVVIFKHHRSLQTTSNKLALSLIVADYMMMTKSWILVVNASQGGPFLGNWGCYAFGCFGTMSGLVQIWTITMISMERFNVIFRPLRRSKRFKHAQVHAYIGCIWAVAVFFSVAPILGWNRFVAEAFVIGCSFDSWSREASSRIYVYILMVLGYFVPMLVICFCYVGICLATKRSRKALQKKARASTSLIESTPGESLTSSSLHGPASSNGSMRKKRAYSSGSLGDILRVHVPERHSEGEQRVEIKEMRADLYAKEFQEKALKVERRVAWNALLIVGIWLLTWTPYAVIALMQILGYGDRLSPRVSLATLVLAKCSSIVNTFVYGLREAKFCKLRSYLEKRGHSWKYTFCCNLLQSKCYKPCLELGGRMQAMLQRKTSQRDKQSVDMSPKTIEVKCDLTVATSQPKTFNHIRQRALVEADDCGTATRVTTVGEFPPLRSSFHFSRRLPGSVRSVRSLNMPKEGGPAAGPKIQPAASMSIADEVLEDLQQQVEERLRLTEEQQRARLKTQTRIQMYENQRPQARRSVRKTLVLCKNYDVAEQAL